MQQLVALPPTAENAMAVQARYLGHPALFMQEVLGMQLDSWQRELAESFHSEDRFAVSSGHSSGKTAFTAGLISYFIAVHPDPQIIVTANTELQLRQKTWRELAKWHNKSILREWFTWTATTYSLQGAAETWFAAAVPNTPHSAESFAGAHEKYMLLIFDEASAIDRAIWETAEGATATEGGYRKWLAFGNPTRIDGAFFDCFHKNKHRWNTRFLDTRQCRYADQSQIKAWAEDYGEDSDFFRVRVRGLFPHSSVIQLIGYGVARDAVGRHIDDQVYFFAPKLIGVDVARFGDDATVITRRQGLKVWPQIVLRGLNTMEVANRVAQEIMDWSPQGVFVDETGLGAGVVDRLNQLGYSVIGVNAGAKPDQVKYLNKRIEMWSLMAEWIKQADIPDDQSLVDDLVAPEYYFTAKGQLQLEPKDSIKKRGLPSPDRGDSLALTFAYPVAATVPELQIPAAERDWRTVTGHDAQSVSYNLED